jgi:hypothetical protein
VNTLHPNLARIAASYDLIVERFRRGEMSAQEADTHIRSLVARDDDGVVWSIDPSSGAWLRETVSGEQVPDTPPAYGVVTVTPFDVSDPQGVYNPDHRVRFAPVDEARLVGEGSLRGSTRYRDPRPQLAGLGRRRLLVGAAWAALALSSLGLLLLG